MVTSLITGNKMVDSKGWLILSEKSVWWKNTFTMPSCAVTTGVFEHLQNKDSCSTSPQMLALA